MGEESYIRCEGQLVSALVVGNRGTLEIPVFPTMATLVVFQHRIKRVSQAKKSEISVSMFQDKVLMVMPSPRARRDMVVEVNVHANPTKQRLYFRVVGDPMDATVAAAILERGPDHAGDVVIGNRRQNGALLAIIEPGELVRGIVTVHEPRTGAGCRGRMWMCRLM